MNSADWKRAVCIVVLCMAARASASTVLLKLNGASTPKQADTYVEGEKSFYAVRLGDGTGTLTLDSVVIPRDDNACKAIPNVKDCFDFSSLADGRLLRGAYTQGAVTVQVELQAATPPTPSVGATPESKASCKGGTTDPSLQQVYREALEREEGLSERDRTRLYEACPRHVYEGDTAILFYDAEGRPLFAPLPQVDEDDSVQFVFFSKAKMLQAVQVTQCTAAQAFRIHASSANPPNALTLASDPSDAESMYQMAQRCSADEGIEVKVKAGGAEKTVAVRTLPLYRLSLGVGLLYDNTRVTDYRVASVKGESVPVITEDTRAAGLNAVALLSLHLFKNDLTRSPWDFLEKGQYGRAAGLLLLNPTLGVSLSQPLDHLYLGDTLAVYPGLGITFGWHAYRAPYLAGGYQVGDRFTDGTEVPVDKRWAPLRLESFYVGAHVDTAVLAKILAGLNR